MRIFHLCILSFFNILNFSFAVPIVIWNGPIGQDDMSTRNEIENPRSTKSTLKNLGQFPQLANGLDKLNIENVIFINLPELCIEDLSSQPLDYIKASFSAASDNFYLPSLQDNLDRLPFLFEENGFVRNEIELDESTFPVDPEGKNFWHLKLSTKIENNLKRSDAIKKIDEVYKELDGHIKGATNAKVTTILSGGVCPLLKTESRRVSRSLLQKIGDPQLPDNFYYVECIYMYFRSAMTISLSGSDGSFSPVPKGTAQDEHVRSCTNGEQQWITLSYTNVPVGTETLYKLKLKFTFDRRLGSYQTSGVDAEFSRGKSDTLEKRTLELAGPSADTVPVGHSYVCGEKLTFVERNSSSSSSSGRLTLNVNGWQVQSFMAPEATQFGPSWDCVGFFTTGIWMGLITGIMLIFILFYGMTMIVSIKTMDRFDDPKGKTVFVVQQAE